MKDKTKLPCNKIYNEIECFCCKFYDFCTIIKEQEKEIEQKDQALKLAGEAIQLGTVNRKFKVLTAIDKALGGEE